MTITIIPETRTDPKDVLTQADGYEIIEAIIESYIDSGDVPALIYLTDQNGEEHRVTIDELSKGEQCALETLQEVTWEDHWDDVRPIVEAILWRPKSWLNATHEVEVI